MSQESDNEPPESVLRKPLPEETDNEPPESVLRKPESASSPAEKTESQNPAETSLVPEGVEITLDSATIRRRQQEERAGMDMLAQLERQANDILALADATERGEGPQRYAGCRAFRLKLGEFESFCSVIENHLRKLAGDAHAELDHLFHKNRLTILRPSVRALTAMFTRMANEGLPFGFLTVLDEELRALDGMRDMVKESKDRLDDDRVLLEEIDKLEALMKSLRGKATEFVEL